MISVNLIEGWRTGSRQSFERPRRVTESGRSDVVGSLRLLRFQALLVKRQQYLLQETELQEHILREPHLHRVRDVLRSLSLNGLFLDSRTTVGPNSSVRNRTSEPRDYPGVSCLRPGPQTGTQDPHSSPFRTVRPCPSRGFCV